MIYINNARYCDRSGSALNEIKDVRENAANEMQIHTEQQIYLTMRH